MYRRDDSRPGATSQFTFRVAVLSGIALVIFSIIFLRLWYLQVLSGDRYLTEAKNNQVRELRVQAPRGEIVDRNGKVLVDNRTALALQVEPQGMPNRGTAERKRLMERLANVAGMPEGEIEKEIRKQTKELPANPVTLRRDVGYPLVYYLQEHQARFPGVSVERVFVRRYPRGSLGAHIFGYVGEVDAKQLEEPRYEELEPGDQIGQTGLEYQYDHLLRGQPGALRLQVDALGRPRGRGQISSEQATAGNDLRLSIDSGVQSTGEAALASFGGLPGAFVAMDVRSGEVLGMGSYPTFDPTVFTKPRLPQSTFDRLTSDQTENALSNRAIQGQYPTGSTFKGVTATAALQEGLITPDEIVNDTGSITLDTVTFRNAGGNAYGAIAMRDALRVSSDVYFYKLGIESDAQGSDPIQRWAESLGFGQLTGIDLPAEAQGLVPTPEWRDELYQQAQQPDSPGGERIVPFKETDRPWSAGDAVNLAVGQGDLQADPLQLAVAYAAIANGGDVVRPHIAQQVEDPTGRVIQEIRPDPRRHVEISPEARQTIMDGLNAAAMEPGGTSYPVFGNWRTEIAGKTGTAERGELPDQSWYVALAPYPDPRVVVAVTIERGGFGADSAAPAASQILGEYLGQEPGAPAAQAPAGTGATAGSYD